MGKEEVVAFLKINGFQIIREDTLTKDGKYKVVIREDYYEVFYEKAWSEEDMWVMCSKDLNIYWLIGVLTYYGIIDKNYNTLTQALDI